MFAVFVRALARGVLPLIALALTACGNDDGPEALTTVPDAPSNLSIILGEQTVGLSWSVPPNDGGLPIQAYLITIASVTPNNNYRSTSVTTDTSAVVEVEMQEGVQYSIGVAAQNSAGAGQPVSALIGPTDAQSVAYRPLKIDGDTSPSGVFDPSVIRIANGQVWMAYSSVNYHKDAKNNLVQDVGIRLARSDDGGDTFRFASMIAAPEPAMITDTDPKTTACGAATCNGRWVYETPWLVEDSADPDPARRFKLFAHKYFLNPAVTPSTLHHLGAIVMWTSPAMDGNWSASTSILGSLQTAPELFASNLVNAMHGDLAPCVAISEGSASVRGHTIDLALTCVYPTDAPLVSLPQKIVLLRSSDHAKSFQYVSTLLTEEDARALGPVYFTAPALVSGDGVPPMLIATPAAGKDLYAGCAVFPFEDQDAGQLYRRDAEPVRLLNIPPVTTHYGGACSWDSGLGASGVLISDITPGATLAETKFSILATGRTFAF